MSEAARSSTRPGRSRGISPLLLQAPGKLAASIAAIGLAMLILLPAHIDRGGLSPKQAEEELKATKARVYASQPAAGTAWHPPHSLKVWSTRHRGRTFRIIQLPRCRHMEAILSYDPRGQTLRQARSANRGVAACTAGFVHPTSYALADFLQDRGRRLSRAATGRWMLVIYDTGDIDVSANYLFVKGNQGVTAAALGQRLVPLSQDGFSKSFMNRVTDRMGLGLTTHYIYIGAGRSDIWRFAKLFEEVLHCKVAVNTDGGHVVKGKSSTHIVFRWKKPAD